MRLLETLCHLAVKNDADNVRIPNDGLMNLITLFFFFVCCEAQVRRAASLMYILMTGRKQMKEVLKIDRHINSIMH